MYINMLVQTDNSLKFIENKIIENLKWYGNATFSTVLFREGDSMYLYMAKVNFKHKLDKPTKDIVHNYDSVILLSYELEPNEILKIIENLSNKVIDIKDFKGIKISGGFQQDCYHIASKSPYAGAFNEWPFFFVNFSCFKI